MKKEVRSTMPDSTALSLFQEISPAQGSFPNFLSKAHKCRQGVTALEEVSAHCPDLVTSVPLVFVDVVLLVTCVDVIVTPCGEQRVR